MHAPKTIEYQMHVPKTAEHQMHVSSVHVYFTIPYQTNILHNVLSKPNYYIPCNS